MHRNLLAQRADAVARIADLTRDVEGFIAASADSNSDDEHDPEGATIAFEREQVNALLAAARRRLTDLDAAIVREADGTYGVCERCREPIPAERLAARPATARCVGCAGA